MELWRDEIVEEIRSVRDEYAKRFGYDLQAICKDLRQRQAESGRPVVRLSSDVIARKDVAG